MCAALIVHPDHVHLETLVAALREAGIDAHGASAFEEARDQLRRRAWDVLVSTVQLGAYNGLQLVHRARTMYPRITILLVGRGPDPAVEREAGTLGATYVVDEQPAKQVLQVIDQCRGLVSGQSSDSLSQLPSKTQV